MVGIPTIIILLVALEVIGGVTDPTPQILRTVVTIAVPVVLEALGARDLDLAVLLTLVHARVKKRSMVAIPRATPAVQSCFQRNDA